MRRQLYAGGGIANLKRQGYFLGGVTDILGKAGDVVKQVVKSDVGRAALLGATMYGLGGGRFPGGKGFPGMGQGFSMSNILPNIKGMSGMGQAALATGAGALTFGGGDPTKTEGFDMARRQGNVEEYLRRYYREYMQSDWETGWTQDEEDKFVNRYTSEYNQGGRVGLYAGSPDPEDPETLSTLEIMSDQGIPYSPQVNKLDAGAQSIVKTGNYETKDSKLVERYNEHIGEGGTMSFEEFEKFESMTAYYPGDVFSKAEIGALFRDKSLTTNEERKQLHKILMNPGMFPEAEEMLIKMLRGGNAQGGRIGYAGGSSKFGIISALKGETPGEDQEYSLPYKAIEMLTTPFRLYAESINSVLEQSRNPKKYYGIEDKAQGGRIGALGGGVMGGRVGLKVLKDLFNNDEEEEYAQGGRIGYDEGIGPIGSLAMNKENVPQMFVSDESGALPKMGGGVLPDDLGNLTIDDFENIEDYIRYLRMVNQNNQGGRIGKFGGGIMGIGTPGMRLPGIPQMAPDGLEYNMKAGGFQNLGAQEGKDDVNAKLAKNEFVMTADAVRGAGDGNIEVGAQRMYDTMKRLEGKVA